MIDHIEEHRNQYKSKAFAELCNQSKKSYEKTSWPTLQDEEWRRTDLGYLDPSSFPLWQASQSSSEMAGSEDCLGEYVLGQDGNISISKTSDDIELYDARMNYKEFPLFNHVRKGFLEVFDDKFALWSTIWASTAPVVRVLPNRECKKPIQIRLQMPSEKVAFGSQTSVFVEDGAKASVIINFDGVGKGELLHNANISCYVGNNASLDVFLVHEDNIDSNFIGSFYNCMQNDARLRFVSLNRGAMLTKYTVYTDMQGQGSEAHMDGVFFPRSDEHVDIRSVQRHRVGKSFSRALFKGAVIDEAHSVFQGLIQVDPKANDTDAYLTNNNLVLSNSARADSIPMLKIETNDLRCSHGATIGKIDEQQLNYLGTRGLDSETAQSMLIEGYFEEVLSLFPDAILEPLKQNLLA